MNKLLVILGISIVAISGAMWQTDVQPQQVIMEQFDIDVVVDLESRIQVSQAFDGYLLTDIEGYMTTASPSSTDSTLVEIRDITDATIIDTLKIMSGDKEGLRGSLTYALIGGNEIAIKVVRQPATPGKGLRCVLVYSDINAVK